MTKKITVKKVFENTSKASNKQYWTVYTTVEGEKYSVWEASLMPQLQEGMTANVGVEEKGQFKNIKSVVPDSFVAAEISDSGGINLLDEDIAPAPAKPELPEVKLAVSERIAALDVASRLVASGQVNVANLYDQADRALQYYQGQKPSNAKLEAKSGAEEYIR